MSVVKTVLENRQGGYRYVVIPKRSDLNTGDVVVISKLKVPSVLELKE